jgi:uncharacterized protein (TIGR00375 family)
MEVIADLHTHSRYARACSKALTPALMGEWADKKGITVVGTGDFTHPAWLAELKEKLVPAEPGLFKLKDGAQRSRFMLTTEISCIYRRHDKTRRVHNLIFAPSFEIVDTINAKLTARGCNLRSDGRPIVGLDSEELLKIVMDVSPQNMLVPAHAWTPWFAVFGSKSGFDTLEECFGEMTPFVTAIETGLSSDPPMNWRVSGLDDILLISNSDAHSAGNLGREANVFDIPEDKLSYAEIIRILREKDRKKFLYTIEFFPEEGMYHFDGHRVCKKVMHPSETRKQNGLCPVCKKPVTVGVLSRVENLATRPEGVKPSTAIPYKNLVQLDVLIAEALDRGYATKGVQAIYAKVLAEMSEFDALLHRPLSDLASLVPNTVLEAIRRMREGKIKVDPGYDGEYGRVRIFSDEERNRLKQESLL